MYAFGAALGPDGMGLPARWSSQRLMPLKTSLAARSTVMKPVQPAQPPDPYSISGFAPKGAAANYYDNAAAQQAEGAFQAALNQLTHERQSLMTGAGLTGNFDQYGNLVGKAGIDGTNLNSGYHIERNNEANALQNVLGANAARGLLGGLAHRGLEQQKLANDQSYGNWMGGIDSSLQQNASGLSNALSTRNEALSGLLQQANQDMIAQGGFTPTTVPNGGGANRPVTHTTPPSSHGLTQARRNLAARNARRPRG